MDVIPHWMRDLLSLIRAGDTDLMFNVLFHAHFGQPQISNANLSTERSQLTRHVES